eukprot:1149823-Pelagomonas_calceolata.AAC.2
MLTGEDQSQADQPNTLAEGSPAPSSAKVLLQLCCPCRQSLAFWLRPFGSDDVKQAASANVCHHSVPPVSHRRRSATGPLCCSIMPPVSHRRQCATGMSVPPVSHRRRSATGTLCCSSVPPVSHRRQCATGMSVPPVCCTSGFGVHTICITCGCCSQQLQQIKTPESLSLSPQSLPRTGSMQE